MPSSGSGSQISVSSHWFHFCRVAVEKLKYSLEW